jgi:hypothetical protein
MVLLVVLEIVDLQTSVMVVEAVEQLEQAADQHQDQTQLVMVEMDLQLVLEETPTPLQVVVEEDVGTPIQ